MGWYGLNSCGARYGPTEGSCEHGDGTSEFYKMFGILEQLRDW
jgi:hypothetical protein